MSESKHTPGPWRVDEDTRPGMAWNRHIYGPDGNAVCFMAHSDGKDVQRDRANAALIARAPDLAAEVERLRAEHEGPDSWGANAKHLLARCPYTVRQRPGGGPEDIKSSLVVTFMGMQQDLAAERRKVEALEKDATRWQPIETAPQTGLKVILHYVNRNHKPRTVMARWLTDEQAAETDADDVGLEGGWYECIDNWDDYTEVAIHEGEPTHWMPLPAPPAIDAALAASDPQRGSEAQG